MSYPICLALDVLIGKVIKIFLLISFVFVVILLFMKSFDQKEIEQRTSTDSVTNIPMPTPAILKAFHEAQRKGELGVADTSKHHVCINIHGGIGNQLYMYAIAYYIHKKYGHVFHANVDDIIPYFNVTEEISGDLNTTHCPDKVTATHDTGYDPKVLENVATKNVLLDGYFQSYRYWFNISDEIRHELRFQPHILREARKIFMNIVLKSKNRSFDTTYVGVHVRRGDILKKVHFVKFGYTVANKEYLEKATKWFERQYGRVTFVLISDNMKWSKDVFKDRDNIVFVQSSKREIDIAVLTLCDHTIMTTGTFGWWTAFLTGGTTLYYKYTRIPNSGLDKVTTKDDSEFFYPGWIGMS